MHYVNIMLKIKACCVVGFIKWLVNGLVCWLIDWLNGDKMTDQTNGWRNGEFDMKYTILKVRSELEKVIAELIFLYWFSCRISECSRWSSVMSVAYQTLYEIKRKRKPRSYDMGKRDLEYPKLATCSSHESPIAQELKLPTANWKVEGPIPVEGSVYV